MHVLQIGCGALGAQIAQATLAEGHTLTIARRSAKPVPTGAHALQVDVVTGEGLSTLSAVQADIVLYCLAPSHSGEDAYRETYYAGLKNVLAHVGRASLRHVFFISSTRVYGGDNGEWVDDDTLAVPADAGGRYLLEAEQLLGTLPCGGTALRVSGIYGPERRYLIRMAQQQSWPQKTHWTNRIHEQDVVGAVLHLYGLLERGQVLHDHYILTDHAPTLQHEVLQWITACMGWPEPTVPPLQPATGKRLRSQRLQASAYAFKYPDYRAGYAPILQGILHHPIN